MRICEICGAKEETQESPQNSIQMVTLHVCDNCREDRKWHQVENLGAI